MHDKYFCLFSSNFGKPVVRNGLFKVLAFKTPLNIEGKSVMV